MNQMILFLTLLVVAKVEAQELSLKAKLGEIRFFKDSRTYDLEKSRWVGFSIYSGKAEIILSGKDHKTHRHLSYSRVRIMTESKNQAALGLCKNAAKKAIEDKNYELLISAKHLDKGRIYYSQDQLYEKEIWKLKREKYQQEANVLKEAMANKQKSYSEYRNDVSKIYISPTEKKAIRKKISTIYIPKRWTALNLNQNEVECSVVPVNTNRMPASK